MKKIRPIVGITMDDPAGIGPEITARVFNQKRMYHCCRPLVIGDRRANRDAVNKFGFSLPINAINDVYNAGFKPGTIDV